MAINIIKEIENLNIQNEDDIKDFLEILNDRKDSIQWMEPNSDGETYDKWSDRLDDIENICDLCEEMLDEKNYEERSKIYNTILNDIKMHQIEYGGLKRFRY